MWNFWLNLKSKINIFFNKQIKSNERRKKITEMLKRFNLNFFIHLTRARWQRIFLFVQSLCSISIWLKLQAIKRTCHKYIFKQTWQNYQMAQKLFKCLKKKKKIPKILWQCDTIKYRSEYTCESHVKVGTEGTKEWALFIPLLDSYLKIK